MTRQTPKLPGGRLVSTVKPCSCTRWGGQAVVAARREGQYQGLSVAFLGLTLGSLGAHH